MQDIDLLALFSAIGWEAEEPESGICRAVFATEREEDYDLYVMVGEEWVHFAVSPLVRPAPGVDGARLADVALRLNQQMRLVRLALDDAGDLNLLADVPVSDCDEVTFALVVDLLVQYTDALAYELRRIAHEPGYHSAKLGMP